MKKLLFSFAYNYQTSCRQKKFKFLFDALRYKKTPEINIHILYCLS